MVVGQSRVKPTPIFEDTEERRVEFDVNRPTNWEEQDSSPRKRREEIRRPPPSFALLGYKYPTQSPRSILRKMDYQHGAMESTGSLKEKGYVRHARRTVDGQTGIISQRRANISSPSWDTMGHIMERTESKIVDNSNCPYIAS